MATKIRLCEGSGFLGLATIHDAPSRFSILVLAFPGAHAIMWRSDRDEFSVDLGALLEPADAD